ncbi:MAG: chromosome segregation protein SMC, partial [Actinobacteria bacterium]
AGHDAGDVTILPLDRMTAPARPDGERLIDHVTCDDEIRPALEAVIGDVVVADDLKKALKGTSAGRVVTRSGEMVHPSGKVTLGPASESGAGVLMRKRRANELAEEVDALTASVSEAEASVSEAELAVKAAQQDALELGQRLASLTGDHESLREEIGRLESGLTDADAEAERITTRAAEVADRTAKDRPAREAAAAAIDRMVAEIDSLEETAASQREARDALYRDETAAAERLAACQVDIAAVSEREIHLKRHIAGVAAEVAELEETLSSSVMTRTGLQGLQERIRPVHDLYTEMLERAEHWAERLRDRARFEQVDSESLRDTIRGAQDAAREAQADLDARNAAMADLRVEKGRIEIQVKTAAGHVVEDLGMPLETALTQPPIEDRETATDRLHKLRKQIENIGPVNAVAVQEFEAVRRRRDFIAAQSEDLVAGRKLLTRIISAIDRKIRDRFLVTFEEVDRNFQEIFGVLFPGGRASLMLTDPDDPDVTGVEVQAQPPGKKLQKMSLLSGGEKALTALSLLFAVYRTRPCPFYVLDEVDAALDDSNLRRFIALVDAMRERTQFVVVTHQRRTMETADVLYGASMQSDGVTKVVSQRLDRRSGAPADDTPPDGDDAGAVG